MGSSGSSCSVQSVTILRRSWCVVDNKASGVTVVMAFGCGSRHVVSFLLGGMCHLQLHCPFQGLSVVLVCSVSVPF